MRIKAPLVSHKEVDALCRAGADELFCGFEPADWRAEFGGLEINQRSSPANFHSLSSLKKAVTLAHRCQVKVHVALNAFFYSDRQYKAVLKLVEEIISAGADGIILADPTSITLVKERVPFSTKIIAGTDALIFNSSAARFYAGLGAQRIVLPRSMTLREIEELLGADSWIEYEAFIIHDLCFFEDGLCTFCKEQTGSMQHKAVMKKKKINFLLVDRSLQRGAGQGGCRTSFVKERVFYSARPTMRQGKFSFWGKKHIQGCGACALFNFQRAGVASVKILDRNMPLEKRVKATKFIRRCTGFLEKDIEIKEYLRRCKELFKKNFSAACNRRDCYYPDAC